MSRGRKGAVKCSGRRAFLSLANMCRTMRGETQEAGNGDRGQGRGGFRLSLSSINGDSGPVLQEEISGRNVKTDKGKRFDAI